MQNIMCTCAITFSLSAGGLCPKPYSSFPLDHTGDF